jgi:hypothetical protein
MNRNALILLEHQINQVKSQIAPDSGDGEFFEIFVADLATKHYELDYEEIQYGNVGNGGRDGGIDGMYLVVNGELIQDENDQSRTLNTPDIHLILTQSKRRDNFEESVIDKFIAVTPVLFDLNQEIERLQPLYNDRLIEILEAFNEIIKKSGANFNLTITFVYACRGTTPTDAMKHKVELLKTQVKSFFSHALVEFHFWGAENLLSLSREAKKSHFQIQLAENAISPESGTSYVCLVKLREYYNFIRDNTSGKRREDLFEANVRDFQGSNVSVNQQILNTLKNPTNEDFWWLNNGITIIASNAVIAGGKSMQIDNPEIVNGLQTSFSIFHYFSLHPEARESESRNLLIRVIVPDRVESRERIIRATNSQTPIPEEALRSLDEVHRNIEQYLLPKDIFYDRRKNYYKNQGKPLRKIIGIKMLAQAVMSVLLRQPDDARGRPNDLIRKLETYQRLFNNEYALEIYHFCVKLLWRVEELLKSDRVTTDLEDMKTRLEVKFHIMMYASCLKTGYWNIDISTMERLARDNIDDDLLLRSANTVLAIFSKLGATNRVAKGKLLLEELISQLAKDGVKGTPDPQKS